MQAQALQELTQNLQEKCFDKCITRPNGKLDGKQQNCLALCINRYIDTMKVVSQAMVERGPQVRGEALSMVFIGCALNRSNVIVLLCIALSTREWRLGVVINELASVNRRQNHCACGVSDSQRGLDCMRSGRSLRAWQC